MATLTKLKEKFESINADIPAIKKTVFDDLSQINADSTDVYPLMLIKPPAGDYQSRELTYKELEMEVFVFEPQASDDPKHWTEQWDELEDLAVKSLRVLFASQPEYVLVGKCKFTPGHYQHNAQLTAVRASFTLRVFNSCD